MQIINQVYANNNLHKLNYFSYTMENAENEPGTRLKVVLKEKRISQKELSRIIGISEAAISLGIKGRNSFESANWEKISKALEVNLDWLLFGRGEKYYQSNSYTLPDPPLREVKEAGILHVSEERLFPFVPVRARATFADMYAHDQENEMEKRPFYVRGLSEKSLKDAIIFEVNGDSMEPTLPSGSEVLTVEIDPNDWRYQSGGIYVVVFANQVSIKRVKENDIITQNRLTLYSDNERGGSLTIPLSEIRRMFKVMRSMTNHF